MATIGHTSPAMDVSRTPPSGVLDRFWNNMNQKARRGFLRLKEQSSNKSASNENNIANEIPDGAFKQKHFYEKYDKPDGFVVVNHEIIPVNISNDAKLTQCAQAHLGAGLHLQQPMEEMKEFIKVLRLQYLAEISSALEHHLTAAFKVQRITYNQRLVNGTKEAHMSWRKEALTEEKCEKFFYVLYSSFEGTNVYEKIHFETLMKLNIWLSTELPGDRTNNGKLKAGCFMRLLKDTMRDKYRNKYCRDEKRPPAHGVSLILSQKKANSPSGADSTSVRRQRGSFAFAKNVVGWDADSVSNFNKSLSKV